MLLDDNQFNQLCNVMTIMTEKDYWIPKLHKDAYKVRL